MSGLNSWATFSTEWNSILAMYRIYSINRPGRLLNFWSLRVGTYSRWALIRGWAYTQIFENYFRELFFQHSTLLPKSKISGWMVRISEKVSESLGTFPGKYCTNCRCFQSFLSFVGWMESAQNASKKFWLWENRPHVLRTTFKKVCCTCKLDLLTLALPTTSG